MYRMLVSLIKVVRSCEEQKVEDAKRQKVGLSSGGVYFVCCMLDVYAERQVALGSACLIRLG